MCVCHIFLLPVFVLNNSNLILITFRQNRR